MIERLCDPASRAAMAVKARARAEQLTWGHYAARLAGLLDAWTGADDSAF